VQRQDVEAVIVAVITDETEEAQVRQAGVFAAGELGCRQVSDVLLSWVVGTPGNHLRLTALTALAKMVAETSDYARKLEGLIDDPKESKQIRRTAFLALSSLLPEDPRMLERALRTAVDGSEHVWVRLGALDALARYRGPLRDRVVKVAHDMLKERVAIYRLRTPSLIVYDVAENTEAQELLIEVVMNSAEDTAVRNAAISALANCRIDCNRVIDMLLAKYASDEGLREAAIRALYRLAPRVRDES